MQIDDTSRERRLRRLAQRQGLQLAKSRRRNPHAADYGMYWLVDPYLNTVVFGIGPAGADADLDAIERALTT